MGCHDNYGPCGGVLEISLREMSDGNCFLPSRRRWRVCGRARRLGRLLVSCGGCRQGEIFHGKD